MKFAGARDMTSEYIRSRCPNCGRFVEFDANGYYDTAERGADPKFTSVACFCDETCACKFHGRPIASSAINQE